VKREKSRHIQSQYNVIRAYREPFGAPFSIIFLRQICHKIHQRHLEAKQGFTPLKSCDIITIAKQKGIGDRL